MVLISTFCYSQSFSKNNPQIYIKDSTAVYIHDDISVNSQEDPASKSNIVEGKEYIFIANGAQVYGIDNFEASEVPKIKIQRYNTGAQRKAQPKKIIGNLVKKNATSSFIKGLEGKHRFSLSSGSSENAVLNNPVASKYLFLSALFYLLICFSGITVKLFSIHNTFPIRREVSIHYSRPPPALIL
ncbi:hypothetical protein GCM10023210_10020 [Chryseobacterium ginsengisoli]|uniref:Uncharacterized protein n=2 Tax=Chryseobacterium ginsengisoli TaxID=363853 RepID=A0ABP9LX52_9FLAO